MSKTIVSIISEQTIPNYLFIKEMFLPGDTLMFISSKKMKDKSQWIKDALGWKQCETVDVVFNKDGDEEKSDAIYNQVSTYLNNSEEYCVNLTGGTKFLALVLQNLFEKFNSHFYYIPYPKNQIISVSGSDERKIFHRVSVDEYMHVYGEQIREPQKPIIDSDYTNRFLSLFLKDFNQNHFDIINKLRSYRSSKSLVISTVENKIDDSKGPRIEELANFLNDIQYPHKQNVLQKSDIQYLTGGWFEEYVYQYIKHYVNPNDIQLSVIIKKTGNELDVVFTLGNKLYVVECKTGVDKKLMLNEIVYKASALKSALFGLSAKSYIFALSEGDESWGNAASNMGISYYGRSYFQDEKKLEKLLDTIIKSSAN